MGTTTPSHSLPGIFMIDSAWLPRTHSQVSCSVCMHCDRLPDGLTWLSAEQAKEAWQQRGWHLLRAGADEHLRAGLAAAIHARPVHLARRAHQPSLVLAGQFRSCRDALHLKRRIGPSQA